MLSVFCTEKIIIKHLNNKKVNVLHFFNFRLYARSRSNISHSNVHTETRNGRNVVIMIHIPQIFTNLEHTNYSNRVFTSKFISTLALTCSKVFKLANGIEK